MRTFIAVGVLLLLAGCRNESAPPSQPQERQARQESQQRAVAAKPRVVFLGDSLTAGLGLPSDRSYPSLIGRKLNEAGSDVRALVLALGANDGLRGLPTDDLKRNLEAVLERAQARNIPVVLAGMEAPPNNGPDYTRAFRQVYVDLAKEYPVRFVPFLLLGVAGNASLNQGDGIHPNERGAEVVADLVWAELEPVLRRPN
jgi:acyl-CoA thioesterase-1